MVTDRTVNEQAIHREALQEASLNIAHKRLRFLEVPLAVQIERDILEVRRAPATVSRGMCGRNNTILSQVRQLAECAIAK